MRFKVLAGAIALNLLAGFSFSMPAVDAHGNQNNRGKHLGWYKQKNKNWKNHRGWSQRSWWNDNRSWRNSQNDDWGRRDDWRDNRWTSDGWRRWW